MNKTALVIITVAFILAIAIIFSGGFSGDSGLDGLGSGQNVEIKDGIQYITIVARGGYSPRMSQAQANLPTRLIVKTNGTYDCSAALLIRSINYQKILAPVGEEIIDLGTPQPGRIQGICSMGMYNFTISFK